MIVKERLCATIESLPGLRNYLKSSKLVMESIDPEHEVDNKRAMKVAALPLCRDLERLPLLKTDTSCADQVGLLHFEGAPHSLKPKSETLGHYFA